MARGTFASAAGGRKSEQKGVAAVEKIKESVSPQIFSGTATGNGRERGRGRGRVVGVERTQKAGANISLLRGWDWHGKCVRTYPCCGARIGLPSAALGCPLRPLPLVRSRFICHRQRASALPQRAPLVGTARRAWFTSRPLAEGNQNEKRHPFGCLFVLVAGVGFEPHGLRVMSPTSYQAALPRDIELVPMTGLEPVREFLPNGF